MPLSWAPKVQRRDATGERKKRRKKEKRPREDFPNLSHRTVYRGLAVASLWMQTCSNMTWNAHLHIRYFSMPWKRYYLFGSKAPFTSSWCIIFYYCSFTTLIVNYSRMKQSKTVGTLYKMQINTECNFYKSHILFTIEHRKHIICLNWGILLFNENYCLILMAATCFKTGGNKNLNLNLSYLFLDILLALNFRFSHYIS